MNTFVNAVVNQEARTKNGMKARKSTAKASVDLFFNAGAMRGKDIVPTFASALAEDKDVALRIAAWLRDARGGAGERKLFRDILVYLEGTDPQAAHALMRKIPDLGRWDDLFVFKTDALKDGSKKDGNGNPIIDPVPSYDSFSERLTYTTNLEIGLNYLF